MFVPSVVWISGSPTLAQTQPPSQSDDVTKLLADAYLTRFGTSLEDSDAIVIVPLAGLG